MKLRVLAFLAVTALVFAFSACMKEEIKKSVKESLAIDLQNIIGTWEGSYVPGVSEAASPSEVGEIEIKGVEGNKEALVVDSKKIKGIQLKITANVIAGITCEVVKGGEIESGSLAYTKGTETNKLVLTIKTVEGSKERSFVFSSSKKK
jgi:lipoprotein